MRRVDRAAVAAQVLEPEAALGLLSGLSATDPESAAVLVLPVLDSIRHDAGLLAVRPAHDSPDVLGLR